jgi:hypothetical protein
MSGIRLSEPASDWIGHDFETRLRLAAQNLYVHGFIPLAQCRRIERKIRERGDLERREAASRQ